MVLKLENLEKETRNAFKILKRGARKGWRQVGVFVRKMKFYKDSRRKEASYCGNWKGG
jgi:hypothetical protein